MATRLQGERSANTERFRCKKSGGGGYTDGDALTVPYGIYNVHAHVHIMYYTYISNVVSPMAIALSVA